MTAIIPRVLRSAAVIVLAGSVTACGLFDGPSPTPTTAAPPSAPAPGESAGPSPAPSGPTGSPSPTPTPTPAPPTTGGLPAGWAHELECNSNGRRCRLHLADERGNEVPGWPVEIAGQCWPQDLTTGPDGTAYAACTVDVDTARVHALTTQGRPVPGWPVLLPGTPQNAWNAFESGELSFWGGGGAVGLARDGTVVVGTAGPRRRDYRLTAFATDGSVRSGWPRTLPGAAQGFSITPDDRVVAWWYEGARFDRAIVADRTVYTRLDLDGGTDPGWPIGSRGAASGPVVMTDGGILYTSEQGRVWRHAPDGKVVDGWPFALPSAAAPVDLGDRFMFVGMDNRTWVTMLEPDGTEAAGWPWRTRAYLGTSTCDTGGYANIPHAVGADGTAYFAPADDGVSVVALDRRGRMKDGWPWRVPFGWQVGSITPRGDGGVDVGLIAPCTDSGAPVVTLTARGNHVSGTVPTSMAGVYEAMRPEGMRTDDGGTTFRQGDPITGSVDYRNTSGAAVILPLVNLGIEAGYPLGFESMWLERLGDDPTIDCAFEARRRDRVRVSSELIKDIDPVTIPAGGVVTRPWGLTGAQTACLAPGDYRLRVHYRSLEEDGAFPVATDELEFTITAGP